MMLLVAPSLTQLDEYAAALRQILPEAAAAGLRHVDLTCDDDNRPSQKVIEANGGTLHSRAPEPDRPGHDKLLFRIILGT